MRYTGSLCIPVLLLISWIGLWAQDSEIIVYSMPEKLVLEQLQTRLAESNPGGSWISLNGEWDLITGEAGSVAGQVRVPFTFQNINEVHLNKRVVLDGLGGDNFILHCGLANGFIRVVMNTVEIYSADTYYAPLAIPIPRRAVNVGDNVLEIDIIVPARHARLAPALHPLNQPRSSFGLLDALWLEKKADTHIQRIEPLVTADVLPRQIAGSFTLNRPLGNEPAFRLTVTYRDGDEIFGTAVIAQEDSQQTTFDLPVLEASDIPVWYPQQPKQLWIEVRLDSAGAPIDIRRERLATRTIAVRNDELQLNGQVVHPKGINYVYQNREGSELFDEKLVRSDLEDIHARGYEAIRVIQSPLPPRFYELCDEIGLLCLQDLPVNQHSFNTATDKAAALMRSAERLQAYASRYNSLIAVGASFYPGIGSAHQRGELQEQLAKIEIDLPSYISTLLPSKAWQSITDFQIVEVLKHENAASEYKRLADSLGGTLFMPSGFSRAENYANDSSATSGLPADLASLSRQLLLNRLPGELKGHFVPVYSDFYLELPAMHLGALPDPSLNKVGLVDLKRKPRKISAFSANHVAESSGLVDFTGGGNPNTFRYILVGFLTLCLFAISYQRYRIFRINLKYSIQKPHGFFVNLAERILIPYKQTFFLLFAISLNGAMVLHSIAFFYRRSLMFDYITTLFFQSPEQKAWIVDLIWDQPRALLMFTLAIVGIFLLMALFVKLLSLFGSARIRFAQAMAATIWAAAPFVFLLPAGVVTYISLGSMKSYWILIIVLLYFHAWFYLRWINGIRVLLDRLYSRTFILVSILLLTILGGLGYWYVSTYNLQEHATLIRHLYDYLQ